MTAHRRVLRAGLCGLVLGAGSFKCTSDSFATDDGGADGAADGASDVDLTGTAGHPCFPNQTCVGTLTCVSGVCVDVSSDAGDATTTPLPLLEWSFDGNGSNTGTVSGYPVTWTGNVSYVAGKFGPAAQFPSGAYGTVTSPANVLGIYAQYTISFWIKASTPESQSFFDFDNYTTSPYGGIKLSYADTTHFSLCASSESVAVLGGACASVAAPVVAAWHNVILRYDGTGTGSGHGAGIDVYEDDVLAFTLPNPALDPIFDPDELSHLSIGAGGLTMDEIRVYDATFTPAQQCTVVIGGTWNGAICTLP